MKKCMKCGGSTKMKKMAKGGPINKPMTYAKPPKGGSNYENQVYGVPNAGMTGPNRNSPIETMKKGGAVKKKMAKGGSTLKPVPADKVGLAKLPTAVRNKMGYQKKGGTVKKK